jgi:tetratricopeptide (TPR) repeat protein
MRTRSAEERGKPDVRLAAAHSQIGIAYMMGGKLALATEYFKQSVKIFKSLEDFQADMLGFSSANLGLAYWIQGQLDEAEEVFATALKEREEAFGRLDTMSYKYDAAADLSGEIKLTSFRTGRILHGYGNVKASKAEAAKTNGDTDEYERLMKETRSLHEAALVQLESTLGQYHHRVADLCHKMAGHYMADDNHESAQ